MKTYIPNNINFRIVSSNAISKFKQDQAFDFNDLNKHRDILTSAAREVILLEYDHWFKWILRLEKVFLLLGDDENISALGKKSEALLQAEMDEIHEVMSIYTDFFSGDLTNFVNFVHRYSLVSLQIAVAETLKENDMFSAFSKIVFYISIYLQQLLLSLREIELLLKYDNRGSGNLYYSGWCKQTCKMSGICPIAERSKYYKDVLNKKTFVLHNMTDEAMDCDCVERIKQHGITITEIVNDR